MAILWTDPFTTPLGNQWALEEFDLIPFGTYTAVTVVKGWKATWIAEVIVYCRCTDGCMDPRPGIREYKFTRNYDQSEEFYVYQAGGMPVNVTVFRSIIQGVGRVIAGGLRLAMPRSTRMTTQDANNVATQLQQEWPQNPYDGSWRGGSPCK